MTGPRWLTWRTLGLAAFLLLTGCVVACQEVTGIGPAYRSCIWKTGNKFKCNDALLRKLFDVGPKQ